MTLLWLSALSLAMPKRQRADARDLGPYPDDEGLLA
jgi:hypothetical protein